MRHEQAGKEGTLGLAGCHGMWRCEGTESRRRKRNRERGGSGNEQREDGLVSVTKVKPTKKKVGPHPFHVVARVWVDRVRKGSAERLGTRKKTTKQGERVRVGMG